MHSRLNHVALLLDLSCQAWRDAKKIGNSFWRPALEPGRACAGGR